MQIGPDERIYIGGLSRTYISVIQEPNLKGELSNFVDSAIFVGPTPLLTIGLQNLVVVPDPLYALKKPFSTDTTICASDIFNLDASTPLADYLWQDGSSDSIYHITEPGIYWVERSIGECALRRDSIVVEVIDNSYEIYEALCPGDTIVFIDRIITSQGIDKHTYSTNGLCDSTIILVVTLDSIFNSVEHYRTCDGDQYVWRDRIIDESGIYVDTIQQETGCDMAYTLDISFDPLSVHTLSATICEGETYSFNGKEYRTSGTYEDVMPSSINGCDSILLLDLEVIDAPKSEPIVLELKEGQTIEYRGYTFDAQGSYVLQVPSGQECDSILNLTIVKNHKEDDSSYYIPNIFSPNGDGRNDSFQVFFNREVQNYELRIYDRWGNLHHVSKDHGAGWFTESQGKLLLSGVYIYHIHFTLPGDNKLRTIIGSTALVR